MVFQSFHNFVTEQDEIISGGLHLPRHQMPQIKLDDYEDFLEHVGASYEHKIVPVYTLKPTQKEYNVGRVLEKEKYFLTDPDAEIKPFISSNDQHILDGHHQWVALNNIDPDTMVEVYEVDLDIRSLLKVAKEFEGCHYKDMSGKVIKEGNEQLGDPKGSTNFARGRRKRFIEILREAKRTLKFSPEERKLVIQLCDLIERNT